MLPGEDPLAALMAQFQPSEAQKKLAQQQMLRVMAANLLGARKGREGQALGQGLLGGMQAQQESLSQAQNERMRLLPIHMQMEQRKKAEAEAAATQQQIGALFQPQPEQPQPAQTFPLRGPGEPAPAPVPQGPNPRAAPYYKLAEFYAQRNQPDQAKKAFDMARALDEQEEFSTTPQMVMGPNGPQFAQFGKRGNRKVHDDLKPAEKLHFVNPGAQVGVGLDPYTGRQASEGVAASMSPDQVERNKVDRANLGLRQQEIASRFDANNAMREVGGGQANVKLGELVTGLRREYNSLDPVKNYRAAVPVAASAKKAPDTPAGDLDLIYAVGKVLDPNSVVREGEMNLVIKAGSPLQRFEGEARLIMQGKGRLTPSRRAQLNAMLDNRLGQLKQEHDRAAGPFVQQARRMKLPMNEVFGQDDSAPAAQPDPKAVEAELRRRGLIK